MTSLANRREVEAREVLDSLSRHILVDGYHVVMDLARSRGSYLYDSRSERYILDFFTSFATCPIGYNHPKLRTIEFRERLADVATNKPANSDIYTQTYANFVETFARIAIPESHSRHLFFVEGGSARRRERAEDGVRLEGAEELREGHPGGEGAPDPPFPARLPRPHRLHALAHQHGRSAKDPVLSEVRLAPDQLPEAFVPGHRCRPGASLRAREPGRRRDRGRPAGTQGRHRRAHHRADSGRGGDNHFRPEFFQKLRELADEHEFLLICDEVQTGVGMTGTMWGWQNMGIVPDIFAFGKKTQVCGIAVNPRVDDVDSVFKVSSRINSTWGGNLVDMLRATRYFEIIAAENLVENARQVGEHLLLKLRALAEEMPETVSNVRGRGLFIALDLPDGESRGKALSACIDNGLMALASGSAAIRMRPPLTLSIAEADEAVEKLGRSLKSLASLRGNS